MLRLVLTLILILPMSVAMADITGIPRIVDGDTIHIGKTKIRLHGIDAPEMKNLLSNAVKFTPEGGKVTVSAKALKKSTALKVVDTGQGIPAEQLPMLTVPFTRAGNNPYLAEQGWGLGLTIPNHW
jgi:C4-dicarboxylate-specific signal transduction histidine kinase